MEPDQSIDLLTRSTVIPLCNLLTNIVQKIQCNYYFVERFLFGSKTYCHEKLGCFPKDGDFRGRFVNFNPNSRETINTQFTVSLNLSLLGCPVVLTLL